MKITIINRADGSGTRLAFEDLILKGQAPKPAQEQDSNGTVKQIVANTPGRSATSPCRTSIQPLRR